MNAEKAKQLLLDAKEVFDALKIKFWLAHGTLLGAVRSGSFISTDNDIDLSIISDSWLPDICDYFVEKGFRCASTDRFGRPAKLVVKKGKIHIDIMYEYYIQPEDIFIYLSKHPHFEEDVILAKHYREENFMTFLDTQFRIPSEPEELLKHKYGEGWKVQLTRKGFRAERKWHRVSFKKHLEWLKNSDSI